MMDPEDLQTLEQVRLTWGVLLMVTVTTDNL